jgi:outer membrane protein TolC
MTKVAFMNFRHILLVSGVALFLFTGCVRTEAVRSDIRGDRIRRFQQWRAEASHFEASRLVLAGPLALEEAVGIALKNSRDVEIALLDRDKARARLLEAYSAAAPTVDLDATYTRLDMVNTFNAGPAGSIRLGALDNYSLNGTINQPLYRGGETSAGVRAAGVYSILTEEQLRGAKQQVIYKARLGYYDALLAIALQKAAEEAVVVARRLLDDTRKGFDAGTVSSFDVLRADVELKSLTAENVQAENRVHLAMTSLYNVLGVSQESAVQLSGELQYNALTPTVEEAVRTAFLQHTDILRDELNVRLYNEAVSAARAGYYPEIDAFFNETYARPDPKDQTHIEWNDTWSAGLVLKYRLFEGFRTVALVRQAETDYAQSKVRLRDTEERVLLAIKQALFSLDDAAKEVVSQEANVEQATEAQRLVELGFREGVRKQVEVLDARRALTRAQAQYAQAVYDHEAARLAYEQSIGILDPSAPGFVKYPAGMAEQTPGMEEKAE